MARNYTTCDRDQEFLLPPSMRDWLPEGHLAWFVIDAVEQMDLSPFHAAHRPDGRGQKAHNPSAMLAVLLYGYCQGQRSSRQLEVLCQENVAYRVLAADSAPDHCAFARFRQRHEAALKGLFLEVLRLCAEAGLVKFGRVALDGTKMKANASLDANRTAEGIEKEIAGILAEAAAKDAEEDSLFGESSRGDELPADVRRREDRLRRLAEGKARLDAEKEEARRKQEEKVARREAEEAASGRKKPGRRPKTPEKAAEEKEGAKANPTDPDSRIVKTRQGCAQGYNAQAAVDEGQIVVAADLTQDENDRRQLHPMVGQAVENAEAVGAEGKVRSATADAGYCSEANFEDAPPDGPELFVSTANDRKRRKSAAEEPPPRGRIPKGLSETERMARKLRTKRGAAIYKERSQTVEPVFGQINSARGLARFSWHGLAACESEWAVICATHNLLKLFRSGKAAWN